jgi:hypothetical protein
VFVRASFTKDEHEFHDAASLGAVRSDAPYTYNRTGRSRADLFYCLMALS